MDIDPPTPEIFANGGHDPQRRDDHPNPFMSEQHPILSAVLQAVHHESAQPSASRFGLKRLTGRSLQTWMATFKAPTEEVWWPCWASREAALQQHEPVATPDEAAELPSAPPLPPPPPSSPWQPRLGPGVAIAASVVLVCALATAAGALWMNVQLTQRLDALSAVVNTQPSEPQAAPLDNAAMDLLRTDLQQLQQRIDALAAIMDLPADEPAEGLADQQQLMLRIAALEQAAANAERQRLQATQQTAALTTKIERLDSAASKAARSAKTKAKAKAKPKSRTIAKAKSPDKPASQPSQGGPWVVNLLSVTSRAEAGRERKRLDKMGIKTEVRSVDVRGQTWYRIRVTGFASAADAQDFGDRTAVQTGLKGAWAARG